MAQVRAKFACNGIEDIPELQQKTAYFSPVFQGSDENKSFSKYTPAGNLSLTISYETQAADFFEVDKEYYVDFTKAE